MRKTKKKDKRKKMTLDKRVITLIIFFAVLAVLLIIGATLFVVRDVKVSFATEEQANVLTADEIITASSIKTGKNIFGVSETDAVSKIEKAHPEVKVINIERKFPSTIIIHVTARVPIVAVKIKDENRYLLLDREMFAVEELAVSELSARETALGHKLTLASYELSRDKVEVGKMVSASASNENAIAQNVLVAFENEGIVGTEFSAFLEKIGVEREEGRSVYQVKLETRSGVDVLFEADAELSEKVKLAYQWYCNELSSAGSTSETVTSGYATFVDGEDGAKDYFAWYRYSE